MSNSTNPMNPSNPTNRGNPINYLTIDVEDYFQVHAFSTVISPAEWDRYECRVEKNTYRILDLLDGVSSQELEVRNQNFFTSSRSTVNSDRKTIKATFFILGWIAERYPQLVKEIHARGHEIASHGYGHKVIYEQSREQFREDVRRSKQLLEDLIAEEVLGYRAPTYSIIDKTLWALQILREEGYRYDSSIFPIRHDYYGMPHCPRFPFIWNLDAPTPSIASLFPEVDAIGQHSTFDIQNSKLKIQNWSPSHEQSATNHGPRTTHNRQRTTDNGQRSTPCASQHVSLPASSHPSFLASWPSSYLFEFPLSTLNLFGQRLPIAGGGYFRLFPYWLTHWALNRVNNVERQPFIFYLHPWEMDPDQPRLNHVSILSRFRHYNNLHKTKHRFARLLQDFSFTSILDANPYLQN